MSLPPVNTRPRPRGRASAESGAPAMLSPRLDRALFSISLQLIALRIPARKCNSFMQRLSGHILQRPKIKPIQPDGDQPSGTTRLLLLAEGVSDLALTGLPEELRQYVQQEGGVAVHHHVQLGYDKFSAEQVLRKLLPAGLEVPSAYEQVGHIAHMNLRDELLPYKSLIGEVILDKNIRLRTVVNKVETISNEFRVFPMEVIAGEPSLCTSTRENGATFHMDFREVYWNSRLEREHRRIVELLAAGDVVCDMFCGIGPFVVPAAAMGCAVYANDLNPASVRWLRKNVAVNKVGRRVRVSNMCGRDFLRQLVASPGSAIAVAPADTPAAALPAAATEPPIEAPALVFGEFQHVLMNLPASGIEFLDAFVGAFDRRTWRGPLPRVHCYCFSKEADAQADVLRRAEAALGCALPDAEAHIVRDVAPSKLMLCASFVLPDAVAWRDGGGQAEAKRQRKGSE